jgi:hypothetical protein
LIFFSTEVASYLLPIPKSNLSLMTKTPTNIPVPDYPSPTLWVM